MQKDTQQIIQERYEQLPPELQQAIKSIDFAGKLKEIAAQYSLRIDQSGALQTEVILIMLGLEKSDDFIVNLVRNAEITEDLARAIATDVNTNILGSIKESLRQLETEEELLEAENDAAGEDAQDDEHTQEPQNESLENNEAVAQPINITKVITPSPEETLSHLENPSAIENAAPINILDTFKKTQNVDFVDHLLNGAVSSAVETTQVEQPQTPPQTDTAPTPQTKKYTADPYREPIE